MTSALVIGAGPAGLMAAETLARAGLKVTVVDKMPSVGRKFLMAGKSGLNITKAEPADVFRQAYYPENPVLSQAIDAFGPDAVQTWARGLEEPLFTGSTGRVFPKAMKASPLLRAWLRQLDELEVTIQTKWMWRGWENDIAVFKTPEGSVFQEADATILALGGASWARLGSDGRWSDHIADTAPFKPANIGFLRTWSQHMTPFIGKPVKGIALQAGDLNSRGEIVLSASGMEGGGIYEVSRSMREGAPLYLDLVPDIPVDALQVRWAKGRSKITASKFLKSALRLPEIKIALFNEVRHNLPKNADNNLLGLLKALPVAHEGPRPLDEAISTGGGVRFDQLDARFMLRKRPGVFCAGEMLDWEAPTGGYLITGCLATGRAAAFGALNWIESSIPSG